MITGKNDTDLSTNTFYLKSNIKMVALVVATVRHDVCY